MKNRVAIGVDVGTSGVRAIAIDAARMVVAQASSRMAGHGDNLRSPAVWRAALEAAFGSVVKAAGADRIVAIAVDGTSGTMLPVGAAGRPLGDALMYNDATTDRAVLDAIAAFAPETSAALGSSSALARAIRLQGTQGAARVLHQADWIAGLFSGRFDMSDENNALKTGYDPLARAWPDWIAATGLRPEMLPAVVAPGALMGPAHGELAKAFGLDADTAIVAGTTDGCASFLATGASEIGDGVTALGTTLTLKLLSDRPVFAPAYGIYSHRMGDAWLAGGASNTGGAVLAAHFADSEIEALSATIDPHAPTGLCYYPLTKPGERFPVADPDLPPRMEPVPADRAGFLKAILEGIAAVEAQGYAKLAELGAPRLATLRTVGGGSRNAAWTAMRRRMVGVPSAPVLSEEAAFGAALLALNGAREAGLT